MMRAMRSVQDIIQAAGGPDVIAPKIEKTPDAVKKWRVNGIPYPYWPLLITEAKTTAAEILAANMAIKAEHDEAAQGAA